MNNTTKNKKSLGRHGVALLMIGVMLVTAPATWAFATRVFPSDPLRQITLMIVTEIALLAWHMAGGAHARGEQQRSVAQTMTWVSLAGVVGMSGAQIAIEFAQAGLIVSSQWFGIAAIVVLISLIAAHLWAAIYYAQHDPDRMLAAAQEIANDHIQSAILDATMAEATNIAGEIAADRAHAFAERIRRQHRIASHAERNSVNVVEPVTALPVPPDSVFKAEGPAMLDGDGTGK